MDLRPNIIYDITGKSSDNSEVLVDDILTENQPLFDQNLSYRECTAFNKKHNAFKKPSSQPCMGTET